MVQSDPRELESSLIFQTRFADAATNQALAILNRNLQRIIDIEEEDHEKYTLSLSILNYLKSATLCDNMQRSLNGKAKIFKQIMLNEERFSSNLV